MRRSALAYIMRRSALAYIMRPSASGWFFEDWTDFISQCHVIYAKMPHRVTSKSIAPGFGQALASLDLAERCLADWPHISGSLKPQRRLIHLPQT